MQNWVGIVGIAAMITLFVYWAKRPRQRGHSDSGWDNGDSGDGGWLGSSGHSGGHGHDGDNSDSGDSGGDGGGD